MNYQKIEIQNINPLSNEYLFSQVKEFGIEKIISQNAYEIYTQDRIEPEVLKEIFIDPVEQKLILNEKQLNLKNYNYLVEVKYKKGVTDNSGKSADDAFLLYEKSTKTRSIKQFLVSSQLTKERFHKVATEFLGNELIQELKILDINKNEHIDRFKPLDYPSFNTIDDADVKEIDLSQKSKSFSQISQEMLLALNDNEMKFIHDFYQDENRIAQRKKLGLPKWPTDIELEVIAQTWSEHCKHKIFAANIDYTEAKNAKNKLGDRQINSLYKEYIKQTTKNINAPWTLSVFSDNAGIVDFDENINLCIKVETHNSPSALDPYGGALTGILGVNRDILGTGMGAKPIANTDVFCFAPNDWPNDKNRDLMPNGPKSPRIMLPGVHKGVEDGGNKSGIPTVNGAIYFDQDFAGKPLVFVGTVGVSPKRIDNQDTHLKYGKAGDLVVVAGGAVGKDGIHGATFSSLDLDDSSPTSAVQIGDPLTQKRLSDFILKAQKLKLFTSITDNGAGGISSSVGEMAHTIGGADIDLAKCPLKYPGLKPYEIMISESQERMTFAVDPQKWDDFKNLAQNMNVQVNTIGKFNSSGRLRVSYKEKLVADFDQEFLHESLPQLELKAFWEEPKSRLNWSQSNKENIQGLTPLDVLPKLLNLKNIRSKESWVRQFDHEVGGATHIKPFMEDGAAPSNAGAIWLYPHGGQKNNAVAVACGLNPKLSLDDPYYMALNIVDEAIRNLIAVGVNPSKIALLDNFCWPDPIQTEKNIDGEYRLAQLARTCIGLKEICEYYKTPLISGKDSMKNNFRGKNFLNEKLDIAILPTLLVTAMGQCQIDKTCGSSFQAAGDLIYQLGNHSSGLYLSELQFNFNYTASENEILPTIDYKKNHALYTAVYQSIQDDLLESVHDISDGGLLCSISESLFGKSLGAELTIKDPSFDFLFSEGAGRFIISVKPENKEKFEKSFSNNNFIFLGTTTESPTLKLNEQAIELECLNKAWKEPI